MGDNSPTLLNTKRSIQIKAFFFTCQNYTFVHEQIIQNFGADYLIYGYELDTTTNKPFLQGYVELGTRKSLKMIQKSLAGFFVEPRTCSQREALEFILCDKKIRETKNEKKFIVQGTLAKSQQGRRTDRLKRVSSPNVISDLKVLTQSEVNIETSTLKLSTLLNAVLNRLKDNDSQIKDIDKLLNSFLRSKRLKEIIELAESIVDLI